jgi:hypothetical protein
MNSFEKIELLASVGQKFPEFEKEFKHMIGILCGNICNKNYPYPLTVIEQCKKYFEQTGKLAAVKYWKNEFDCVLMDAKKTVEKLADDNGWVRKL